MAHCGPSDIDLLQTYDDYPVISMMQFEDLGFCGKGEGSRLVRDRDLTVTGDFPHNTSGGQLSAGQAGGRGRLHRPCRGHTAGDRHCRTDTGEERGPRHGLRLRRHQL